MKSIFRYFQMETSIPFLPKGAIYAFVDETGFVYRVNDNIINEYPLRKGLAGYLCLLRSEKGIMKEVQILK